MKIHVLMVDNTGKPHFLWHILTQGRKQYVFPRGKRTPLLKARKRRRTSKSTLSVDPFPGFSGETFVIHGGQTVKAVEGNQWYEEVVKEVEKQRKRDPLLKEWDVEFDIVRMKRGS